MSATYIFTVYLNGEPVGTRVSSGPSGQEAAAALVRRMRRVYPSGLLEVIGS